MQTQTTQTPLQGFLRLPEVTKLTGLSRSSIYRLESLGLFPGRVKLSESATAWRTEEVQAWCASRPRAAQGGAV